MALGSTIKITDDKLLCDWSFYNPAIYIPELGVTVYGCESWWSKINTTDDFSDISDLDIQNVWYVKLIEKFLNKD